MLQRSVGRHDADKDRHAGRQTISTADVLLLTRRNEGLEAVIRSFLDQLEAGKSKVKRKRSQAA